MQENDLEREFQVHQTQMDYGLAEFYRWFLAFLIGATMGFLGFVVDLGIEALNDVKYSHTVNVIKSQGTGTPAP